VVSKHNYLTDAWRIA